MATIRIRSSNGNYAVECERGGVSRAGTRIARLGDSTATYVISSPRVWELWGRKLTAGFRRGHKVQTILFDDSETAKRISTVEALARKLVSAGADRQSTIVALGGGVVGDLAGFVAATYLRGVRLVSVPTTLLAQVDSSIGGKTGVNLPEGKNLIGAIYPAVLVITDPDVLITLPHRELRSGLFEVIKYGVIADPELFRYVERHMTALVGRDPNALSRVIERSVHIKARVVEKDERERGLRKILNFGHTLGHALEATTGYRKFLHGEAVAWGMYFATLLGVAAGLLGERDAGRIMRLIASVGPLPGLGGIGVKDLRPILANDKKARGGRVQWVLPRSIGKVQWGREIAWPMVSRAFSELPALAASAREAAN